MLNSRWTPAVYKLQIVIVLKLKIIQTRLVIFWPYHAQIIMGKAIKTDEAAHFMSAKLPGGVVARVQCAYDWRLGFISVDCSGCNNNS